MSIKLINNFDDLKNRILDLKNDNDNVKLISVSCNGKTTTLPYRTVELYYQVTVEGNDSELQFSVLYPEGCTDDDNEIIEIKLFFGANQKTENTSDSKSVKGGIPYVSYGYYANRIFLRFTPWSLPEVMESSQSESVSDFQHKSVTVNYSDVPALLKEHSEIFSEMYATLIGTERWKTPDDDLVTFPPPSVSVFPGCRRHR